MSFKSAGVLPSESVKHSGSGPSKPLNPPSPDWPDAAFSWSSLAMDTNHPVQIFFIGIGEDADIDVGRMLAGATGAKFQRTTEEDLANLLEKFFKDF